MRTVILTLCLLATFSLGGPRVAGEAKEAACPIADGVWKLQLDFSLDGRLGSDAHEWPYRLTVIRDRLYGEPADESPDRARLSGEIVTGSKATLVHWRQDNKNIPGYSQFCSGRVVNAAKIAGTWYDTEGQSGDFVMTLETK